MVNGGYNFKSLVHKTKNLLKNSFEFVELHAVDNKSYLTISLVAQTLMKYKYVTLSRLKTKTHQTILRPEKIEKSGAGQPQQKQQPAEAEIDPRVILQPKLVVHLRKTAEFDSIYDDFEAIFKKVEEEHSEDIKAIDEISEKNPGDEDDVQDEGGQLEESKEN